MSPEHDQLEAWAIFRNPEDAPGRYIVRKFDKHAMPTDVMFAAVSLESAREFIPAGLICFQRNDCDSAALVETWI